jgi:hypothetical protein
VGDAREEKSGSQIAEALLEPGAERFRSQLLTNEIAESFGKQIRWIETSSDYNGQFNGAYTLIGL